MGAADGYTGMVGGIEAIEACKMAPAILDIEDSRAPARIAPKSLKDGRIADHVGHYHPWVGCARPRQKAFCRGTF
jgi:hypothetical protein